MRSFYSQPCSHSVHEAEEPPSPPAEGLGWGPAQEPAQGPRERQGTRAEGGPDLVCGGRGTVWRVVLVGMAQRMDCWARNAAGESPPLPGSLPPGSESPCCSFQFPGPGLSLQWKDTHSCHVRGRTMVSTGVIQSGSAVPAFICCLVHRPTMPQEPVCGRRVTWPNCHLLQGKKRRLRGGM